jgi:hypothetical protein
MKSHHHLLLAAASAAVLAPPVSAFAATPMRHTTAHIQPRPSFTSTARVLEQPAMILPAPRPVLAAITVTRTRASIALAVVAILYLLKRKGSSGKGPTPPPSSATGSVGKAYVNAENPWTKQALAQLSTPKSLTSGPAPGKAGVSESVVSAPPAVVEAAVVAAIEEEDAAPTDVDITETMPIGNRSGTSWRRSYSGN